MTFRAVAFDFYGTLTMPITRTRQRAHLAPVAAAVGCDPESFRRVWAKSFYERATGRFGTVAESLFRVARTLGECPDADQVQAACDALRADTRDYTTLRPEAISTLTALRARGLRTAVVSDCTTELADSWPALEVATHVDVTVFSCVLGRHKPDPELYRQALHGLEVPAAACLYVGDGGSDELAGAVRAGMAAVRIESAEHLSYGQRPWVGPRIDGLAAVLDLVGTPDDITRG